MAIWSSIPLMGRVDEMAGKFDLFEDKGGHWRFNLVATNGQVIASSESYNSKAAAQNGIESVRKNAPDAKVVEREA
jgi:uncharacterized protein YegP (UPF0339 family)